MSVPVYIVQFLSFSMVWTTNMSEDWVLTCLCEVINETAKKRTSVKACCFVDCFQMQRLLISPLSLASACSSRGQWTSCQGWSMAVSLLHVFTIRCLYGYVSTSLYYAMSCLAMRAQMCGINAWYINGYSAKRDCQVVTSDRLHAVL